MAALRAAGEAGGGGSAARSGCTRGSVYTAHQNTAKPRQGKNMATDGTGGAGPGRGARHAAGAGLGGGRALPAAGGSPRQGGRPGLLAGEVAGEGQHGGIAVLCFWGQSQR